ncbi:hypothetical protein DSO57_1009276 [Entomophthora muscae]|uniref:Uncharacterized protein n=1 Tax=Entomophthora muscae TaxID=34485 RepID=A0ACC2UTU9_9FUNG|nr:hypothetical protein DSO57_1009276 [Entomophthora muscae]
MECGDLTVRIFKLGKAWLGGSLLNPTEGGDQEVGLATTQAGTANNRPETRQGRLPASPMLPMSPSVTPMWFKLTLSICDWLEAFAEGNDWLEVNLTLVLNRSVLTASKENPGSNPVDVNRSLEAISGHETKGDSQEDEGENKFPFLTKSKLLSGMSGSIFMTIAAEAVPLVHKAGTSLLGHDWVANRKGSRHSKGAISAANIMDIVHIL